MIFLSLVFCYLTVHCTFLRFVLCGSERFDFLQWIEFYYQQIMLIRKCGSMNPYWIIETGKVYESISGFWDGGIPTCISSRVKIIATLYSIKWGTHIAARFGDLLSFWRFLYSQNIVLSFCRFMFLLWPNLRKIKIYTTFFT